MSKTKRPPIVAVLGHVDHGKTSILDKIRASRVQAKEAGGITQSIGAYQVEVRGKRITFIDTPGHEAFTTMRARGGQTADIVVLVVAANDGVQPQTIEAINHAKAANVPIIVALNKIDLDSANPDKTKSELANEGVLVEGYGGDVPIVETSATEGVGIDELLGTILAKSEELNLQAEAQTHPTGVIIESFLDERKGPVATVIVQDGTLRVQDVIIAGETYAKVKALNDWQGERFKEAAPATPAEVLGFKDLPPAGVSFKYLESAKAAQERIEKIKQQKQRQETRDKRVSAAERIAQQIKADELTEIPIIIKADTRGSLEAIEQSLEAVQTEQVKLKVLHQGIGSISEADILLAASSESGIGGGGIVLGFNVGVEKSAQKVAQHEKIIYRTYEIIYSLLEELKDVVAGEIDALTPTVLGEAKLKEVFKLSDGTQIAGCEVTEGKVKKGHKLQVIRGEEVLGEARIVSLRHGKEEVGTVEEGMECGIGMDPELPFMIGDIIQTVAE